MRTMKALIKDVPTVGPLLLRLRHWGWTSSDYWDRRYRVGGNSGPGSYNRLAAFKAEFLNRFVAERQIKSVVEFGCGDGSQLSLAQYPSYLGIDVSAKAVALCKTSFAGDASKSFVTSDELATKVEAELALSLDVVYHLVEDAVFEHYMRALFRSASRFVIVYSSDMDREGPSRHIVHRQFSRWVAENEPGWYIHSILRNVYPEDAADPENTSFADFYVFARGGSEDCQGKPATVGRPEAHP